MTISIQYVKMPTSEALTAFTEKRLNKLAAKYSWLISANVYFKLEKEKDALGKKICEIELSLPGPKIFASSKEDNFEVAVKETLNDLSRQLKKRKETTFNR
jgi:putative sigma-54 modulation protein